MFETSTATWVVKLVALACLVSQCTNFHQLRRHIKILQYFFIHGLKFSQVFRDQTMNLKMCLSCMPGSGPTVQLLKAMTTPQGTSAV